MVLVPRVCIWTLEYEFVYVKVSDSKGQFQSWDHGPILVQIKSLHTALLMMSTDHTKRYWMKEHTSSVNLHQTFLNL
jgi:hypothetical protein